MQSCINTSQASCNPTYKTAQHRPVTRLHASSCLYLLSTWPMPTCSHPNCDVFNSPPWLMPISLHPVFQQSLQTHWQASTCCLTCIFLTQLETAEESIWQAFADMDVNQDGFIGMVPFLLTAIRVNRSQAGLVQWCDHKDPVAPLSLRQGASQPRFLK